MAKKYKPRPLTSPQVRRIRLLEKQVYEYDDLIEKLQYENADLRRKIEEADSSVSSIKSGLRKVIDGAFDPSDNYGSGMHFTEW